MPKIPALCIWQVHSDSCACCTWRRHVTPSTCISLRRHFWANRAAFWVWWVSGSSIEIGKSSWNQFYCVVRTLAWMVEWWHARRIYKFLIVQIIFTKFWLVDFEFDFHNIDGSIHFRECTTLIVRWFSWYSCRKNRLNNSMTSSNNDCNEGMQGGGNAGKKWRQAHIKKLIYLHCPRI